MKIHPIKADFNKHYYVVISFYWQIKNIYKRTFNNLYFHKKDLWYFKPLKLIGQQNKFEVKFNLIFFLIWIYANPEIDFFCSSKL